MTKAGDKVFESPTKCCICDNAFVDGDIKVRVNCDIIGKYRVTPHGECNIKVKLKEKVPIVFINLKRYDAHLTTQHLNWVKKKGGALRLKRVSF